MNILMISIGDNILSNPIGDSLERQKEYAKRLGHIDMIVYSPKRNNLCEIHYKNISIYPTKSLNMFTFVFDVLKIANKIIKNKKIDVITTQDPFGTALVGYFLKKKYNIPLHIQNHSSFFNNYLWIKERPILFRIFNQLAHFTLKRADRLRVVNSNEKQKYIDILKIDKGKIDIAPVPVDIGFWQTPPSQEEIEAFKKKYDIDNKPVLSWAGRFVKVKNIPFLFKVVSKVNKAIPINFLLAGDKKCSDFDLRNLEYEFNIKPLYLGVLTHNELKILYYITNVYLHTSLYEGFGRVVLEAQASGCPVVSTYTAGSKDIIENSKSGFLVDSEKEFSKKIEFLLKNQSLKKEMGEYAKKMIRKKFNMEKMFKNIIESILKTKNE